MNILLWCIFPRQSRKCFYRTSVGKEFWLHTLPDTLKAHGPGSIPWDFDPNSLILYMLFQTTDPMEHFLPDSLDLSLDLLFR